MFFEQKYNLRRKYSGVVEYLDISDKKNLHHLNSDFYMKAVKILVLPYRLQPTISSCQ